MAKKYNVTHLIHIFKIRNIITMTILAKDQTLNDALKIEVCIIDIPYENQYTLQTEYNILTNSYPNFNLNSIPLEVTGSLQKKLTDLSHLLTKLTLRKARI